MKVFMTGTAIINSIDGKTKKRVSKEYTVDHEYDVSDTVYKNIKQSCVKGTKGKNKQPTD